MADGLTTAGIQVGAVAIAADITKVRLHSADASGSSGTTNQTAAADKTVSPTAAAGVVTIPSTAFTGGAANGAIHGFSVWSGTTYRGYFTIDAGDTQFNAAGEFTLNASPIAAGTSS
jgi:hypothetical protein